MTEKMPIRIFYENGLKKSEYEYLNDKFNGKSTSWDINGVTKYKGRQNTEIQGTGRCIA